MKKFTAIILAAALVFAVAGQVSASTLETSGEFRGRYWYANNWAYFDSSKPTAPDDSVEWWDQRLRLNTTWKVTDTVKVITRADILENYWQTGQPPAWGNSDGDVLANTNPGSFSNNEEIDFDWAYAMFNVGDVTASLLLGRYHLQRQPPASRVFSLVLARQDGEVVILHDHTSADAPARASG